MANETVGCHEAAAHNYGKLKKKTFYTDKNKSIKSYTIHYLTVTVGL